MTAAKSTPQSAKRYFVGLDDRAPLPPALPTLPRAMTAAHARLLVPGYRVATIYKDSDQGLHPVATVNAAPRARRRSP